MKTPRTLLFESLPETSLPEGLSERIFLEIARLREREMRQRLFVSRMRIGGSGLLALSAIFFAGSRILGSEFAELVSLLISDTWVMAAYGRELFWLLLEVFPAILFAVLFVPLFFFLVSLGLHAGLKNRAQFSHLISV